MGSLFDGQSTDGTSDSGEYRQSTNWSIETPAIPDFKKTIDCIFGLNSEQLSYKKFLIFYFYIEIETNTIVIFNIKVETNSDFKLNINYKMSLLTQLEACP